MRELSGSTLTAGDGNVLAATLALSTSPTANCAVALLPDVRGLHPYYEALADALAESGVHALAIDLYGRTAGAEHRDESFEWQEHRAAATDAGVREDVRAARGGRRDAARQPCSCWASASADGRRSCRERRRASPASWGSTGGRRATSRAGRRQCARRARVGSSRRFSPSTAAPTNRISDGEIRAFYDALHAAHVLEETVVYDGAPHGFFDRAMAEHTDACDDAWHRVLRFMGVPASR